MMNMTKEERDGVLIFYLEGKIDVSSTATLMNEFQEAIENNKIHLILDLEKVSFLSSSGIGTIAATYNDLKERGGSISLTALTIEIQHVFEITGLNRRFKIFSTVDEAIDALKN